MPPPVTVGWPGDPFPSERGWRGPCLPSTALGGAGAAAGGATENCADAVIGFANGVSIKASETVVVRRRERSKLGIGVTPQIIDNDPSIMLK